MNASQERVIEYIRNHLVVSAGDIAHGLSTSAANARHHLYALSSAGLVEAAGERRAGEKGRPVRLYRLSRVVQGDGLPLLCSSLLSLMRTSNEEQGSHPRISDLASLMIQADQKSEKTTITDRLKRTLNWLNLSHYHARWEARADGAHVILSNCPFAMIIETHPELCQLDAGILEKLLDSPVLQKEKLARNVQGVQSCLFLLV